MRAHVIRLSALVVGVVTVVSCDGGPLASKFGNGIAGGTTGTAPVTPPAAGSVDSTLPFVQIQTPLATPQALINVGDSILVVTRIVDDRKVKSLRIYGLKYVGSAALGTLQEIQRYPPITAPTATFPFRPGLQDTTITRYLKAATPVDTAVDSLVIWAVVTDSSNNTDSTRRVVQLVTGPKLTITAPLQNDSVPRGMAMAISVRGQHPTGLDTLNVRVRSTGTLWTAGVAFDVTIGVPKFPPNTRDTTVTVNFTVPAAAPSRGQMIIEANAIDVNFNPGSAAPVTVFARAAANIPPRVYQTVPLKLEHRDSVTIIANADGIARIGRIILDSALNVVDSTDTVFTAPFTANRTQRLPLNLSLNDQGRRLGIISFVTDSSGVTGYSLPAGVAIPVTNRAAAFRDTTLITFGRTFALPRSGVAADIAVDEVRGNVFVSNTNHNLLEIWNNTTKLFSAAGVQVGSQPWGLFVAGGNRDTLLVGNSGGTTISRVDMSAATPVELLNQRIRTRNSVNFEVLFTIDATSGKVVITWDGSLNSYSDRPQYVAQSAGGRIYYSTRPTTAKTPGTLRWLDPAFPFPDARQIHSYGRRSTTEQERYVILNVDSIAVVKGPAGTAIGDTLVVCDHPYGQLGGDFCTRSPSLPAALAANAAAGGDMEAVLGLTLSTLSLTDTNFVAASADRNWLAFGEGNAAKITGTLEEQGTSTARIMMVNDPPGPLPGFFSHAIQVDDIQENAAEKVFGLALDTLGLQLLTHGDKTFVAAVDLPFHMRLDGVYDSFSDGAGVAFHPQAQGTNTVNSCHRVGFTATRSGLIEAFDVAHYNNRGRYTTKANLYGPLRVTRPLPGDAASIILKLYGLTDAGLIVIDLQGKDIIPVSGVPSC